MLKRGDFIGFLLALHLQSWFSIIFYSMLLGFYLMNLRTTTHERYVREVKTNSSSLALTSKKLTHVPLPLPSTSPSHARVVLYFLSIRGSGPLSLLHLMERKEQRAVEAKWIMKRSMLEKSLTSGP